jgi:uncharacterized coiled-coil protein SlyX
MINEIMALNGRITELEARVSELERIIEDQQTGMVGEP